MKFRCVAVSFKAPKRRNIAPEALGERRVRVWVRKGGWGQRVGRKSAAMHVKDDTK